MGNTVPAWSVSPIRRCPGDRDKSGRATLKNMQRIALAAASVLATLCSGSSLHAQQNTMTFFVTSAEPGQGRRPRRPRGCRPALPDAGAGGGRGQPHLARLPERRRGGRRGGRQRQGSHRQRTLAERQGRGDRQGRRRAARRRQQPQQADGAQREGRARQRPRRHAQPARHPDRLAARRHAPFAGDEDTTCGNWTQERRRRRHGRAPRSHGPDDSAPAKSWNSSHPSRGCGARGVCVRPAARDCSTALRPTDAYARPQDWGSQTRGAQACTRDGSAPSP